MTDTVTSQNNDLASSDTLYVQAPPSRATRVTDPECCLYTDLVAVYSVWIPLAKTLSKQLELVFLQDSYALNILSCREEKARLNETQKMSLPK
jgi:hypothetical protein